MSGMTEGQVETLALDPDRICPRCLHMGEVLPVCPVCQYQDGQVDQNRAALPPGTILDGRYFIGLVEGQGGFGITYRGRNLLTQEAVAIKEYLPTQLAGRLGRSQRVTPNSPRDEQYFAHGLKRFKEEAEALRAFSHPVIVRVLDYLEANSSGYLVMPFLEGLTFAEYVTRKGGRVPFDAAVAVLVPVMDALRLLHQKNLLHRDVSPENIYVTSSGAVILFDFGAARSAIGETTKTIFFKPGFASLEVQLGRKQGPYSDIYGLAATLYCACTGEPPPLATDRDHADDLVPPSARGVSIAPGAERALLRALAVQAGDRYRSIRDFQDDLLAAETATAAEQLPVVQPDESSDDAPLAPLSLWLQLAIGTGVFVVVLMLFVMMA
jgi:serine/threonine protein kinase